MNAKTKLTAALLALFVVSGCAGMQEPAPELPVVPCEDEASNSNFEPQQGSNEYVNYTQTAANYREYAERNRNQKGKRRNNQCIDQCRHQGCIL